MSDEQGGLSGTDNRRPSWLVEAIEQAGDLVFLTDTRDCFAYVNRRTIDLLGIPPVRLIGEPVVAAVVPQDHAVLLDVLRAARFGGAPEEQITECRFVSAHADQTVALEVVVRSVTVRGEVLGCIGVGRPVLTRQESLAQRLASERVAAIGDLANQAADKINNPLAVLVTHVGNIERAAEEGRPADRKFTEQMRTAIGRIAGVTEELATLADTSVQKLLLGRAVADLQGPLPQSGDE